MNLTASFANAARAAVQRVGQTLLSFAHDIPAVPGAGNPALGSFRLPRDAKQQALVNSREALAGRTTYTAGPVPSWISTYAGELTPRRIRSIHNEVLVQGYMVNKASLDEEVLLSNSHVQSVDGTFRDSITGQTFDIRPADNSPLALHIADYQMALAQRCIEGYQESCRRLLFGNAGGYALEEAVYDEEPTPFQCTLGGEEVTVIGHHPRQRQWVTNKHTRWAVQTDRLEIDMGTGGFIVPPGRKFVVYECSGDFQARRRGYLYPGIWLHLIKTNSIARWAVVLEIWGIPVPWGKVRWDLWQDKTRRAEYEGILRAAGRGEPFLTTDDFDLGEAFHLSDGDARGMHAALVGWATTEESKLIQGESLTTEVGGQGSYALSETHADTKEVRVANTERRLAECEQKWWREALKLACYTVNYDGSYGAVGAGGLADVLSTLHRRRVTPEEILAKCGRPSWRIQREMTPAARMELYKAGVNELGLQIDANQPYQDFGFNRPRRAGDPYLRGKPQVVADTDRVTGSVPTPGDPATQPVVSKD